MVELHSARLIPSHCIAVPLYRGSGCFCRLNGVADIPCMKLEAQPPMWAIGRHTTIQKPMYVPIRQSDLSFVKGSEAQQRIRARTRWSEIAQELSQKALSWLSESSELLGFNFVLSEGASIWKFLSACSAFYLCADCG